MHCICFATLIIKQQILSITAFVLLCDHINAHDPNLRRGWGPESHRAWKISRVEQEQPCSRQGWNNGIKQRDTSYLFPVLVLLMISLFLKLSEQNTLSVLVQSKHWRWIPPLKKVSLWKRKCITIEPVCHVKLQRPIMDTKLIRQKHTTPQSWLSFRKTSSNGIKCGEKTVCHHLANHWLLLPLHLGLYYTSTCLNINLSS